jgi:hypothetical protein
MRAAALIGCLLVATPVAADDAVLAVMGRKLDRAADAGGHVSAVIACYRGHGDAEKTAAFFTEAGWSREDDSEMGLTYFASPAADLGVTMAADGSFCEVASETRGTDLALSAFVPVLAAAGLSYDTADTDIGCAAFLPEPGVRVEITSTGQDPVCASETTSAVRVIFE